MGFSIQILGRAEAKVLLESVLGNNQSPNADSKDTSNPSDHLKIPDEIIGLLGVWFNKHHINGSLFCALRDQQLVGFLFCQKLGKRGMVWNPVILVPDPPNSLSDSLIESMLSHLRQEKYICAQTFMQSTTQKATTPYIRHGFSLLTQAWGMRRIIHPGRRSLYLSRLLLSWKRYPDWDWPIFREVVEKTWKETRDFPEIAEICEYEDSLNEFQDIAPDLNHWYLVQSNQEWLGGIILACNPSPLPDSANFPDWELVYFGVVPEKRNQGFGRTMLDQVIDWIRQAGGGRMFLHVDSRNRQAVHLYQSNGFEIVRATEVYLSQRLC